MTRRAEEQAVATSCAVPALLLSKKQLGLALGGMSVATVERLHNSGRLGPQPLRLGTRLVRWNRNELVAWIDAGCPPRHEWTWKRT